jgi:hypothetical protein
MPIWPGAIWFSTETYLSMTSTVNNRFMEVQKGSSQQELGLYLILLLDLSLFGV